MDSAIDLLNRLLTDGRQFTFASALQPTRDGKREFGGPDTPEWLAWKTRAINLVRQITAENSPATRLTTQALAIRTEGNYPDRFDELN
jgi:hypothetical protein